MNLEYSYKLFVEALVVGVVFALLFFIFQAIVRMITHLDHSEWSLWTWIGVAGGTGIFAHVLFEIVGANRWYLENSAAALYERL